MRSLGWALTQYDWGGAWGSAFLTNGDASNADPNITFGAVVSERDGKHTPCGSRDDDSGISIYRILVTEAAPEDQYFMYIRTVSKSYQLNSDMLSIVRRALISETVKPDKMHVFESIKCNLCVLSFKKQERNDTAHYLTPERYRSPDWARCLELCSRQIQRQKWGVCIQGASCGVLTCQYIFFQSSLNL